MNDLSSGSSNIRQWYDRTKWIWVLFALTSVVLQATRSAESSPEHLRILEWGELTLTFLFDIDIVWRFLAHLPQWRTFFDHGNNWLDLLLAVGSSVIQIPAIRDSGIYPWLTIFQLARFYRVILEVPRMRPLLVSRVSYIMSQCLTYNSLQSSVIFMVSSTCRSSYCWQTTSELLLQYRC